MGTRVSSGIFQPQSAVCKLPPYYPCVQSHTVGMLPCRITGRRHINHFQCTANRGFADGLLELSWHKSIQTPQSCPTIQRWNFSPTRAIASCVLQEFLDTYIYAWYIFSGWARLSVFRFLWLKSTDVTLHPVTALGNGGCWNKCWSEFGNQPMLCSMREGLFTNM